MSIDIEKLVTANETGFVLLGVLQSKQLEADTTNTEAEQAKLNAKIEFDAAAAAANAVREAHISAARDRFAAKTREAEARTDAASVAVRVATEALKAHQDKTKEAYGTSLDFFSLLRPEAASGGKTRL